MKKILLQDLLQTIGANLHSIRNARKETLQAVAKSIGVTHPIISKIENGRYDTLQLGLLIKLCNHYEITLQQIMALEQAQIFQLTQHNNDGSQRLVGQELAQGYEQSILQYKAEINWLRDLIANKLKTKI